MDWRDDCKVGDLLVWNTLGPYVVTRVARRHPLKVDCYKLDPNQHTGRHPSPECTGTVHARLYDRELTEKQHVAYALAMMGITEGEE
jgi:hypothetical protein